MIDDLISKRALELESYKAENRIQGIALDKNELPWGLDGKVEEVLVKSIKSMEFNRYPDSSCTELKEAISKYAAVDPRSICIGNGSDELINVVLQTFIDPGDAIAVYNPTFSMYKIYGTLCGARVWEYDLDISFDLDLNGFTGCLQKEKPKLVFLCNPNNPTGKGIELPEIEEILKKSGGIVIVDEAYFEFSGVTASGLLSKYDNLIILRTFSKAFGLAGLRIGYMLACPEVISYVDRVRSPFNVNAFAQAAAAEVLKNLDKVAERIEIIKSERERLTSLLSGLKGLQCFESRSNFILIRSPYSKEIGKKLREEGIFIRGFSNPALENCLRVTIGGRQSNDKFYEAVKEVLYERV
ncbi:MAG: histidinol-phosphate transaminase [Clostridiaceae bacterium]|nr:histidinol-phosphate transaminase [Clostridiaceae bacterium]